MKELKKKLKTTEDNLRKAQGECNRYFSALKDIHSKVAPLVSTTTAADESPAKDKGQQSPNLNGGGKKTDDDE